MVSELFDPDAWDEVEGFDELTDITYHRARDVGAVRVAFDRPEVRNAFRPHTVDELYRVLDHARQQPDVGCVLLTGNGPSRDGVGRSARAATSASGAGTATGTPRARPRRPSTRPGRGGCTSSRCSGSSA